MGRVGGTEGRLGARGNTFLLDLHPYSCFAKEPGPVFLCNLCKSDTQNVAQEFIFPFK